MIRVLSLALGLALAAPAHAAQSAASPERLAVQGELVYTMDGAPLTNGVVLVEDGKIVAVGPAADVAIPADARVLSAAVVTPGLIDAHSVVGVAGWLNTARDQEQLEASEAVQPELRAIDAYDPREPLVAWVRSFGVTTIHTGHAPGAVISGQTLIAKTTGDTVLESVLVPYAMLACTLGDGAERADGSPGTSAKAAAMLRAELIRAQEYAAGLAGERGERPPARNLRSEALQPVLAGEVPLLVTADRVRDLQTALRIAREFDVRVVLDGAAEAHLMQPELVAAGLPITLHATMRRPRGDARNLSLESAARLVDAGLTVALQSGYESYVPKTRVVLFEAAVAAANGLGRERALATITIDAARVLGIADRVGSLTVGKDADLALYDADPFEYTSHCVGVVIDGAVVSTLKR